MTPRGLADEPLAPATSSVDADHLGVGARLVDEYQLGGVKAWLAVDTAGVGRGNRSVDAGYTGEAKGPDFWCAFEDGEVKVIGDEPDNA
jgi:hypothetical protein